MKKRQLGGGVPRRGVAGKGEAPGLGVTEHIGLKGVGTRTALGGRVYRTSKNPA